MKKPLQKNRLFTSKAMPTAADISVFRRAASTGNIAEMKAFLKIFGRDGINRVDVRSPDETTMLMKAAYNGQVEAARFLLDAGADIEAVCPLGNVSPLIYALNHAAKTEDMRIVEFLVQQGAEVNRKNVSALLHASDYRDSITQYLLSTHPPLETRHEEGYTAFHHAVLKYIERANVGNAGRIRMLAAAGADINAVDNTGFSALMMAGERNHEAAFRLLLDLGADTEITDKSGYKVDDWVMTQKGQPLLQLLQKTRFERKMARMNSIADAFEKGTRREKKSVQLRHINRKNGPDMKGGQ